jgi:hypothetical protein
MTIFVNETDTSSGGSWSGMTTWQVVPDVTLQPLQPEKIQPGSGDATRFTTMNLS